VKLLFALSILIFVYIIGWHQLYGQFIHEFYRKYQWYLIFLSIPNTILSIYAAKILAEVFEGKIWPNRIFTFSIGIIMFTILAQIYFNEKLSLKTLTLIGLSGVIVILQVIWR
jgi:hypothetical protein